MSSAPQQAPQSLPTLFRMPLALLGALMGVWAVTLGVLLPFFWPPALRWLLRPPTSIGLSILGMTVVASAILSPFLLILGVGTATSMQGKRLRALLRKALAAELLLGSFLWLLLDIVRLFQADPHVQRLLIRKLVLMDLKMLWVFPGLFFAPLALALGYGLLTRDKIRDQAGLFFTTLAYESLVLLAVFGQILQSMQNQGGVIATAVTKKAFLGLHSDIAQPLAKSLSFLGLSANSLSKSLGAIIVALYFVLPSGLLLWSWGKQKNLSTRTLFLILTSPLLAVFLFDRVLALLNPHLRMVVLQSGAALLSITTLLLLASLLLPLYALVGLSIKQKHASLLQAAMLWLVFALSFLFLQIFFLYQTALPAGQNIHKITLVLALVIPLSGILGVFLMQTELRLRTQMIFSAPLWVPFFFLFFLWSLITHTTIYFMNDLAKRDFQPPLWMRVFPLSLLSLFLFPILLVADFLMGIVRQLGESLLDLLYPREERITEESDATPVPTASIVYALGSLLLLTLPLWGIPALLYLAVRLFVYEAIILQLLGGSAEEAPTQKPDQTHSTP